MNCPNACFKFFVDELVFFFEDSFEGYMDDVSEILKDIDGFINLDFTTVLFNWIIIITQCIFFLFSMIKIGLTR